MKFEIQPYVSIGPLKWGMSNQEVGLLLGPAIKVTKNRMGSIIEFRNQYTQSFIYDSNLNLIEVTFSKTLEICCSRGIDLLETPSDKVISALINIDKGAVMGYDSIIFQEIGVALTGFMPEDLEIRAAGAFSVGRWDSLIPTMTPFHFI